MPHDRPSIARRRCRPVRLVRGEPKPHRRPSPLDGATAGVYDIALARVSDMQRLFPDFYGEHIADRLLTPRALYAAVTAFLSLVNLRLFEIEDSWALNVPGDPLRALQYRENDEVGRQGPLLCLEEGINWLSQPRPQLYGVGIEGILEDETPQCALTLALWQLCRDTSWGIGVDVADVIGYSHVSEETAELIKRLPPLPPVEMDHVVKDVKLSGRHRPKKLELLISYAFARTGNPMADTTNYEVDIVYNGDIDTDWKRTDEIVENANEAAEICDAYHQWARIVDDDPRKELGALAKALYKAARPYHEANKESKALIDLLTDAEIDQVVNEDVGVLI